MQLPVYVDNNGRPSHYAAIIVADNGRLAIKPMCDIGDSHLTLTRFPSLGLLVCCAVCQSYIDDVILGAE